jgi:sugar/nucleoside kinase (ribokinase family)
VSKPTYDLLAIGRPVVDLSTTVEHRFLQRFAVEPGSAAEISPDLMSMVLTALPEMKPVAGGSLSNTVANVHNMGLKGAFIGKVADDTNGRIFRKAFEDTGVDFPTWPHILAHDTTTATCLILSSAGNPSSVLFAKGVADSLDRADLNVPALTASRMVLAEANQLCGSSGGVIAEALGRAKGAGATIAITLQDIEPRHARHVARHLKDADIVFGNSQEFAGIYGLAGLPAGRDDKRILVMTDAADGSAIATGGDILRFPVHKPFGGKPGVGPGDAYAAGFIAAVIKGRSLIEAGHLGAEVAHAVLEAGSARPGNLGPIAAKHFGALAATLDRKGPSSRKGYTA